jgi:hypothetical protein
VALILGDGLLEVLQRDLDLTALRVAAGEEEVDLSAAVLLRGALQVLDRLGHVAAVLLEDGGVVEVLGLRERGTGIAALPLADRQVHAGAVDELLLLRILLNQVDEVPLRLVQLLLLEGGDAAVVVLAGVLGVLGELPQGEDLLRLDVRRAAREAELLHLLLELVDPDRQSVGESLDAHLLGVVLHESEFRFRPALRHLGHTSRSTRKNGVL